MTEYTLLTLECWSCPAKFAVFTDLSAHHLECHERPLRGASVATWLSAGLTRDECGLLPSAPPAPWLQATAEPVPGGEEAAPAPGCRTCGSPVPDSPEHLGSQLCGDCFAAGFLAYCTFCGENHPEHLRAGGRGCATWHQGRAKPPQMEEGKPPCFCSHAAHNHIVGSWRMPCDILGCRCSQFTAAMPSLSALETFVGRCRAEGLSYNVFDARPLLDTLGVPPDAPAVEWEAGVNEALQRWRDRVTAPPRRMEGHPTQRWGWPHHGEHAENGYCATAQCVEKKGGEAHP